MDEEGKRRPLDKTINTAQQAVLQKLLRKIRTDAGLRQEDLAVRLGEPQSFVSKYELGERRLDLIELKKICDAVGTPLTIFVRLLEKALNEAKS